MFKKFSILALSVTAVFLSACGGGSDDGGGNAGEKEGPLHKYAGAYTSCDDHEKVNVRINPKDQASAFVSIQSEFYEKANCTGALLGKEVRPYEGTLTYVSTADAVVADWPAEGGSSTQRVDRVNARMNRYVVELSGPGARLVNGKPCIMFAGGGSVCYDSVTIDAQEIVAGMFAVEKGIVMAGASDKGYDNPDFYAK